jgi:outer membrane protein assembly factor BamD
MSYFKQRDYIMGGHYFEELASTFPNSSFAEEAYYMSGFCQFKMSPRPSLDQEYTYKAINTFRLFMLTYPQSKWVEESKKLIFEMQEKLVEKSFMNAKLYFDLDDYKAAIIALRNSLTEFPDTHHREELLFMLLKANYLLAENSVESKKPERYQDTVDEYYSYAGEFPKGNYSDEAIKIYNTSMEKLGQEIN